MNVDATTCETAETLSVAFPESIATSTPHQEYVEDKVAVAHLAFTLAVREILQSVGLAEKA